MDRRQPRSIALLAAAVALLAAACGATPGPTSAGPVGPSGTGPEPTAASPTGGPAATPAATPTASGGTIVSDATVPAGVQFIEPATATPWGLPADAAWGLFGTRAAGDTTPSLAAGGDAAHGAVAAVLTGDTWRRTLLASTASIKRPTGYTVTHYVTVRGAAASASGYLVVADANIGDAGNYALSGLGYAWFSRDGTSWAQTDFRKVFGAKAFFTPSGVIADGTGWLVAGALTDRDMRAKSQIVVLASDDGTTWRVVSRIKDTWTLTARTLERLGDRIVLTGTAWICSTGGSEQYVGIGNPQLRLWSSADHGATWTAGDWTAGGVNAAAAAAPTSASGCSSIGIGQLAAYGLYLGVVNGRAVVVAPDHAKVATSADLATWVVGDLPGGKPSGGGSTTYAGRALAVVPDGDASVLLSLEPRRDEKDATGPFGLAVIAWRTTDGAIWTRQPAARPVETSQMSTLIPAPDGSVYLATRTTTSIAQQFRHSVAGKVVTQLACQPAPAADCSFATVSGSLPGADLTGIDLYGSVIAAGTDLSGANLSGATLTGLSVEAGANLKGADLTGASASRIRVARGVVIAGCNLTKANLSDARIDASGADATGITLTGANLKNATLTGVDLRGGSLAGTVIDQTTVGPSLLSANLDGLVFRGVSVNVGAAGTPDSLEGFDFGSRDLAGWHFGSVAYNSNGDMRGADFSGAKVGGSGFIGVDLTGATFPPGAKSQLDITDNTAIYFYATVICPDGKAADKSGYEYDCRLPK